MKIKEAKEKVKKWANEHAELIFWGGVLTSCAGLLYLEYKVGSKIVDEPHTSDILPEVEEWVFDELRTDIPIRNVFATIEYEDGDIGIVEDIHAVAIRMAEQANAGVFHYV